MWRKRIKQWRGGKHERNVFLSREDSGHRSEKKPASLISHVDGEGTHMPNADAHKAHKGPSDSNSDEDGCLRKLLEGGGGEKRKKKKSPPV